MEVKMDIRESVIEIFEEVLGSDEIRDNQDLDNNISSINDK